MSGSFEFVYFEEGMTDLLFQIRNAETVRTYMNDPAPLDYAKHCQWVRDNLLQPAPTAHIWFIRFNGIDRGFLLIRNIQGTVAEGGIMIRGARTGLGAKSAVLFMEYLFTVGGFTELRTKALKTHRDTISSGLGVGAREIEGEDARERYFVFSPEACHASPAFRRILSKYQAHFSVKGPLPAPLRNCC